MNFTDQFSSNRSYDKVLLSPGMLATKNLQNLATHEPQNEQEIQNKHQANTSEPEQATNVQDESDHAQVNPHCLAQNKPNPAG